MLEDLRCAGIHRFVYQARCIARLEPHANNPKAPAEFRESCRDLILAIAHALTQMLNSIGGELLAEQARPVVIAEGEKVCDNLARIGVLATCNAGGADKWTAEHSAFLRGRQVIVLPDNDEAGCNHAQQVAQSLQGIAESVRIVELPGLPSKGDISDWIAAGGTKEELKRLADAAPVWTATVAQPWPEIVSFDVLDLPEFSTHVLPDALQQSVPATSCGGSNATATGSLPRAKPNTTASGDSPRPKILTRLWPN
ncbi:MAG: toprim domain-containing protein [Planctomycetaceae bacterium]